MQGKVLLGVVVGCAEYRREYTTYYWTRAVQRGARNMSTVRNPILGSGNRKTVLLLASYDLANWRLTFVDVRSTLDDWVVESAEMDPTENLEDGGIRRSSAQELSALWRAGDSGDACSFRIDRARDFISRHTQEFVFSRSAGPSICAMRRAYSFSCARV